MGYPLLGEVLKAIIWRGILAARKWLAIKDFRGNSPLTEFLASGKGRADKIGKKGGTASNRPFHSNMRGAFFMAVLTRRNRRLPRNS